MQIPKAEFQGILALVFSIAYIAGVLYFVVTGKETSQEFQAALGIPVGSVIAFYFVSKTMKNGYENGKAMLEMRLRNAEPHEEFEPKAKTVAEA